MLITTYEIHLTSGEILADNLSFDELPILFQAYQDWYNAETVIACFRTFHDKKPSLNRRSEFYRDWEELIFYLTDLANLY